MKKHVTFEHDKVLEPLEMLIEMSVMKWRIVDMRYPTDLFIVVEQRVSRVALQLKKFPLCAQFKIRNPSMSKQYSVLRTRTYLSLLRTELNSLNLQIQSYLQLAFQQLFSKVFKTKDVTITYIYIDR